MYAETTRLEEVEMTLGYLVWWRVSDTTMDTDTAQAVADKLGIPAPARPIPVDVFRKLAGQDYARGVGKDTTRIELHPAKAQKTMLVRHIVAHTHRDGIAQSHERVGEAVFYKPPRKQPWKARVRVTMDDPTDEWLARYADQLRTSYQQGLEAFDAQGVRRLVRSYLSNVQALFVDGVYFLRDPEHVSNLLWLFTQLGSEECRCHWTPVEDTESSRFMLATALERAVADGSKLDLLEAFIPLGVVPDRLWQKLEQS